MSTQPDLAAGQPRPNQGVIHDLGYKHYDGPRLGRGLITRALYIESAKGAYGLGRSGRSKIMPMLLLAAITLPAVIIAVVGVVTKVHVASSNYTSYVFRAQLLVMIYVAGQAPASVSRDLRFRVMSLYFSRPLRRIDYVLAKYAALASALFLFMTVPLTILLIGSMLAKQSPVTQLPDYLRSLAAAAMLALLLAGLALVIAAITPRRGLGVAAIVAVLAMLAGVQATLQSIAIDQNRDTFAGYAGLLSPFSLVDGVQSALLGADSVLDAQPPGIISGLVFLVALAALVAGCFGALQLRYRKVTI